jgi:glucose-1-phosphate thymidylyltransferase
MIYYPLSVLMLAGIRDILIITTPHDQPAFRRLLGDGSQWQIKFEYIIQDSPGGLAQAFILGEEFLAGEPTALILGDNIFYGHDLWGMLQHARELEKGALIFAYQVENPQEYGVVEFDASGKVVSLEEKPAQPRSHYAVTGLYFYDRQVTTLAKQLRPSARGELEITDLNRKYMEAGLLRVEKMGRGYAWLDTGSHHSMLQASQFIETVEQRQGLMIGCPEEVAYRMGWITRSALRELAAPLAKCQYGNYLLSLAEEVEM